VKWIVLAAVAIWLATGVYIVGPDEQGVVRRFGAAVRVSEPGPHFHIPWPMEKVNKVKVKKVRRLEIGFRTIPGTSPAQYRFVPAESLMLTGDEQIVDAQVIVQYQVSDPEKFLFNVYELEGQDGAIKDAAEVALRQVVGQRPIDDVLIEAKLEVQVAMQEQLQEIIDGYDAGARIVEVKLQTVRPPKEVEQAFSDVVSAKEDRERLIKEAEGYREDILPKARGRAQRILRDAEGYKEERVKKAQGEAERFLAVLKEYEKSPEIIRKRLYLEAMEEVLPGLRKFIIEKEVSGGLLEILPLQEGGSK
jgi:membrane protease subunit HflK